MSNLLIFVGRVLMSALFLLGAYWHVTNWETALAKTASTGVFRPDLILVFATVLLVLGGVSLLLGYKTRVGAVLLIVEIIMTALIFHPFWNATDADRTLVLLQFLNRTALCGGLLVLISAGPGSISIDRNSLSS